MSRDGAAPANDRGDQIESEDLIDEVASDEEPFASPGVDELAELEDAGGEVESLEEVLDPLAVVTSERDGYLDALQRLQAEFENFRKRVAREQADLFARATETLLEALLPVLDALDLAIAHSSGTTEVESDAGVLIQIQSLLGDILKKEGLDAIAESDVAFDPRVHDAVVHEPGGPEETVPVVAEVLRAGYELKGRVLRPAMVKVRG